MESTMIKVTFGNNLKRESTIVSNDSTLRSVLDGAGFDYSRGAMTLDGATLKAGDLDKTFASFGITTQCFLLSVSKQDNA